MKLIKYLEKVERMKGMGHCNPVYKEVWVEYSSGNLETLREIEIGCGTRIELWSWGWELNPYIAALQATA